MRVALLALNACAGDAIGEQLVGKVRFCASRGWEVRLFIESAARLHPDLKHVAHVTNAERLWQDAEQRGYLCSADLVLVEFGVSFSLLRLLPALPRPGPKVLFEYHGLTPAEHWEPSQRWRLQPAQLDRGLAWSADLVLTKSRFTQKELARAAGLPAERFRTLPGYVDPSNPGEPLPDVRGQLGLNRARVVLFVGRLARNKRAPLLIEALARLRDLDPPVHAVLVGDQTDVYAAEAERCRELAGKLGLKERLHLLGHVRAQELRAWYRSADALAAPSVHEGFCLPVIEAMAVGLPVVAARAAALPETVGSAGLTFTPDDADDLARQLRRVLEPCSPSVAGVARIAVVAARFGAGFAGGAERSLQRIALALKQAGREVEIFTTTAADELGLRQVGRSGTRAEDGVLVHRFPALPCDAAGLHKALDRCRQTPHDDAAQEQAARGLLHSPALVAELNRRRGEFCAIIVGPYGCGLALDLALQMPELTVLLPCFHDEPLARVPKLLDAYRRVAGVLYHTPEERELADAELGVNQPNSAIVGAWVDTQRGSAQQGQARCGPEYVVYCGRYVREKGFHQLLDWMERFQGEHPDRLRLAVMGQSGAALPRHNWLLDLGHVAESVKRDVLAGARAVALLSANESLSLVALEAWSQGTPIIAAKGCAALRGQIERSGGGIAVGGWEEFACALLSLRSDQEAWRERGQRGRRFVEQRYASAADLARRVLEVLDNRQLPLPDLLRDAGRKQAQDFVRAAWENRFGAIIDEVMSLPSLPARPLLQVEPLSDSLTANVGAAQVVASFRVTNIGSLPALGTGPAAVALAAQVPGCPPCKPMPLPSLLLPGRSLIVQMPVPVPGVMGAQEVFLAVRHETAELRTPKACVVQAVEGRSSSRTPASCSTVENLQETLAELHEHSSLPDGYEDVTQGFLAPLKRRIKRKLLHNFQTAYVDVLARQQTRFNEAVVKAMHQLAEGCAAGEPSTARLEQTEALLRKMWRSQRRLARRLARLEQQIEALARS